MKPLLKREVNNESFFTSLWSKYWNCYYSLLYAVYVYKGWPNLLYAWAAYHKTQVTKRAATWKYKNTNLFAIYSSVTSSSSLERLAKVILYGTLATTVAYQFTIFLHFAIEIKNEKQTYIFLESSRSRMRFFEPLHAARESQFGQPWFILSLVKHGDTTRNFNIHKRSHQ